MSLANKLIEHYGFTYKTIAVVWEKYRNGKLISLPGTYTRSSSEFLLVATKG